MPLLNHFTKPIIDSPEDVEKILSRNEGASNLILEILDHLGEVFPDDSSFVIEPFIDPETENPTDRIYVVVKSAKDVEQTSQKMDRFEDWWLDHCHRLGGILSVAVDYV